MKKLLKKKFNRKKLKRLIEKAHAPQTQNVNPFDKQFYKNKSSVTKAKDRSVVKKADQKRKDTLLLEYKKRHVHNKTIDLRIGRNQAINTTLNSQRLIKERQKQSKRKLYNLNEDEELTHLGTKLSEIESFEKLQEQHLEDTDINADMVSKLHFGGFEEDGRNKSNDSNKTYLQELISVSKKEKHDKQKEKENLEQFRERLDETWKELRTMVKSSYNKRDDANQSTKKIQTQNKPQILCEGPDIDKRAEVQKTVSKPMSKQVEEPFKLESYDAIFKSLQFEDKASNQQIPHGTQISPAKDKGSQINHTKEENLNKRKNKVPSYSADALSFAECAHDPRVPKGSPAEELKERFELRYDKEGKIASKELEKIFAPSQTGADDKLMSLASIVLKGIKMDLGLVQNAQNQVFSENLDPNEDLGIYSTLGGYNSFAGALSGGDKFGNDDISIGNYQRLISSLDAEQFSPKTRKKGSKNGDQTLDRTLTLMSRTVTFTLRFLVDRSSIRFGGDQVAKFYETLKGSNFLGSRPNLLVLVLDKIVTTLARYVSCFKIGASPGSVKDSEHRSVAENCDYPGRKLFTSADLLARLLPYLPFNSHEPSIKFGKRLTHVLSLSLGHLTRIFGLKESRTSDFNTSADLIGRGCSLVDSLLDLQPGTSSRPVRYFPEAFGFFDSALGSLKDRMGGVDGVSDAAASTLLKTLRRFLLYSLSLNQHDVNLPGGEPCCQFSPVLSAFPELLGKVKLGLATLIEAGTGSSLKDKAAEMGHFIDTLIPQLLIGRANHLNSPKNLGPITGTPHGLIYPELLEPLVEAPKNSAAWKRAQMDKVRAVAKKSARGVVEDPGGYYQATPQLVADRKRLRHMYKRDFKTAKKELRKDSLFLARHQLGEQIDRDKGRKEKVKRLYAILADQEGECRALKKSKAKPNG